MRRGRFTGEQITGVLREQEAGLRMADLCRKHGISEATFYAWKTKYGARGVSEAKRLEALEGENGRLKRSPAEAMLDNAVLKDLAAKKSTSAARRACSLLGTDRTSIRYQIWRPDDATVRARLRELAAERRRYRRLGILLAREGTRLNYKTLRPL